MQRKTGFIVKLYEENEHNDRSDKLSSQLMKEDNKAFEASHRLIEIDMDIQEPETYKVLCVSLRDDLLQKDIDDLESLCESGETNMVMERDTGFFIKLYDTVEQNNSHFKHLSPEFNYIILTALESGYRMIELDCDAQT
ncbi:hypothetical protein [Photobacterium leiognathi]|uniref:hypothetical protein n=1 Tax=Photobacterium leiognathi TaxID=553611 RepID=UPI001EE11DBE|nr:hypothetical protein [Photobacterium leiognathi]